MKEFYTRLADLMQRAGVAEVYHDHMDRLTVQMDNGKRIEVGHGGLTPKNLGDLAAMEKE